jgi:NDP-sugar pyrophosphorylase family protein
MILAAGFGRRLRPLTDRIPKPLIDVAGKPLIAYSFALLRAAGIGEVIINLHHRGDEIRAALGDGTAYGVAITYSAEDPILDTGGAIKRAQPFLEGDRFVVLNADSVCDLDLRAAVAWHAERGALATMVLRPDRQAARYGLIEIDTAARIRRVLGQPRDAAEPLTPLMFAGIHVFEPAVFDYMDGGIFGIIRTTYPRLLAAGCPLYGYTFGGYWRALDTHERLAEGRWELRGADGLTPRIRPGSGSVSPPRRW